MAAAPDGCRFAPRCPFVIDRYRRERPPIVRLDGDRWSRCFRAPLEELVA